MTYPTTTLETTYTFYDDTDALFDPTTVTCTVTSPSGTATVYTYGVSSNLTKTSTGLYTCTFDANAYGTWYVKWYGADANGKLTDESYHKLEPTH